ncbi:MAG: adenylate/guanylate cyclase domain-containing protein [Acidimicrobiia bacterium]|nr:adenylate/guanylate cyclase domain-containing protein [Acidimicrobiia bacterium]
MGVWLLSQGSMDELNKVAQDPSLWRAYNFWPVWVILPLAAVLVIHLGIVLAINLFGGPARRRRKAMAREAHRAARELHRQAHAAKAERREQRAAARAEAAKPSLGPERKWVTVMFTDIANSTRLTEDLGDDEWSRILSAHRELVRNLFVAHGGEVVGTQGDGCLGRFPTPAEAVLCAVEVQKELAQTRSDTNFPMQVRIGIHAGEAVEDDGDLVGRVVNVAARVTTETKPGEILVTEPVADYLGGQLRFEDRGLRELRGLTQPRHLLAVRWDEEPSATPPPAPASTSGTGGGSPPGAPPAAPAAAAPPGNPPPPPAPPS